MPSVLSRCLISGAPEDIAARLCHLDGFVFLDSSDASPESSGRISLITACPSKIHRGSLADLSSLRKVLARKASVGPDLGLPTGGLFGMIDYEGQYEFGEYDHLLIYRHDEGCWLSAGDTDFLRQAREPIFVGPSEPISFQPEISSRAFHSWVRRAQAWIAAGDIYQVNLAYSFRGEHPCSWPFARYSALRSISPAPHAAYVNLGRKQVLSASPECFLRMSGRLVKTRPIKGTRPRYRDPERDELSALELTRSAKENAELIMITDLERNDLGQVCEFGSVRVVELLKLERFAQVFHLVSTVEGLLRPECDQLDALRACSPGGSITGAPKRRAREIIQTLESQPRGLYTGAIGYLGWNGESQFNIAIRTLVHEAGRWHFAVGAGIVADSDPQAEYEETLHKAEGILRACGSLP